MCELYASDRFSALTSFIVTNLSKDLSIEVLADRAGLGVRHFRRRFRAVFGMTPAAYVELLRLDESRRRLSTPRRTVDNVAASLGYRSADAFVALFSGALALRRVFTSSRIADRRGVLDGEQGTQVSKSVLYMSMSLDGYIAGANDSPDKPGRRWLMRLHDWMGGSARPTEQADRHPYPIPRTSLRRDVAGEISSSAIGN